MDVIIKPCIGVITPFITGRGPPCTLPETNSSPPKIGLPNRKRSYSNHPFVEPFSGGFLFHQKNSKTHQKNCWFLPGTPNNHLEMVVSIGRFQIFIYRKCLFHHFQPFINLLFLGFQVATTGVSITNLFQKNSLGPSTRE